MARAPDGYALFRAFPGLARRLPRLALGAWPTPLQAAFSLGAAAGLPFELHVKRDDLSSPVYGGNKVRKLELLLAGAKARGRSLVVTSGGLGSNHVVATAALAAAAGMRTRGLLFCQPVTDHVRRNLLAGVALGADLRWVRDYPGVVGGYVLGLTEGLVADGRLPYLLMPGGSTPLSSVGYANAVLEMAEQLGGAGRPAPSAIAVAAGTGGTAAGLLAGVFLAGWDTVVLAVRVVAPGLLPEGKVRDLASQALRLLGRLDPDIRRRLEETGALSALRRPGAGGRLAVEEGFLGEAYGFATPAGRKAVAAAAETEGLELETTYTGKALAAVLAAGAGAWPPGAAGGGGSRGAAGEPLWLAKARAGRPVVFVNTYSAAAPAGLAVGSAPGELVARVPPPLRWCFDRRRRDCRCGLARQNRRFCETVRAREGWEWE